MDDNITRNPDGPVLVIGSAGVDIVGSLEGDLQMGASSPSLIRRSYGGVARNVAENLARLGQPVRILTAVGHDRDGERLVERLSEAGVNVDSVMYAPNCPTGTYLAVLNNRSELQFALDDMRAIQELSSDYLKENYSLFQEASMLMVDANLSVKALRTAFSLARRAKIPVCADPTSMALAERLQPYLSRLYLITPNSKEAGVLCERVVDDSKRDQALEIAKCLVSSGVEIAIVTLAQFGVCYATSKTSGYFPAIRTEVVDPTGAGDALTAAVIFALLNDIPLDDAVRLGVSSATLALKYQGTVSPDLSLEKLYNQLVI